MKAVHRKPPLDGKPSIRAAIEIDNVDSKAGLKTHAGSTLPRYAFDAYNTVQRMVRYFITIWQAALSYEKTLGVSTQYKEAAGKA
jgi:hypothetical protein